MNPTGPASLQLRDIHMPGAAPFWPPAPGWWIVAALLTALAAWGLLVVWRRQRLHRARRGLIDALVKLQADFARERSSEHLSRIALLMRRLALSTFPRERVAALTGRAWLRFLDESGGRGRFSNGPGMHPGSAPYQRAVPADMDVDAFVDLVREWVDINSRSLA